MKKIELFIMPYAKKNEVKTQLVVDGARISSKDNRLTNLVVYQPMRRWLNPYKKKLFVWEGLLAEAIEEFNDKSIRFLFHGCKADYLLFQKSILAQQRELNRNGEAVAVSLEMVEKWDPRETARTLVEILDKLRTEADDWGEDEIMREIDGLTGVLGACKVKPVFAQLPPSARFQRALQKHRIGTSEDAALTVIPARAGVSASHIGALIAALREKNDADRSFLVVNTAPQENSELWAGILSLHTDSDTTVKYLEDDGGDYANEIEKIYYLSVLPSSVEKASKIVEMFPDCDSNDFLLDCADEIEALLRFRL
ncbi:MAG: hypothetical protein LUG44_04225 [Clostridiales bacterium]|nr:hypothetical protein [Clostridiales bacterium]